MIQADGPEQLRAGAAQEATSEGSSGDLGEQVKAKLAYTAPKVEQLGSVAKVALFSGSSTFF